MPAPISKAAARELVVTLDPLIDELELGSRVADELERPVSTKRPEELNPAPEDAASFNTGDTQETAMSEIDPEFKDFPSFEHAFYGVPVAFVGEDGEMIAAGHGLRSYAALNATIRDIYTVYDAAWMDKREATVKARWATFAESCGCDESDHETKHLMEDIDGHGAWRECPNNNCEWLPPCSDEANWTWESVPEGTAGSVPVLTFEW